MKKEGEKKKGRKGRARKKSRLLIDTGNRNRKREREARSYKRLVSEGKGGIRKKSGSGIPIIVKSKMVSDRVGMGGKEWGRVRDVCKIRPNCWTRGGGGWIASPKEKKKKAGKRCCPRERETACCFAERGEKGGGGGRQKF